MRVEGKQTIFMNGGDVSGDKLQRAYRIRIAFFLVCVMAVVAVLATTAKAFVR